jgi:hypothetical protein
MLTPMVIAVMAMLYRFGCYSRTSCGRTRDRGLSQRRAARLSESCGCSDKELDHGVELLRVTADPADRCTAKSRVAGTRSHAAP